jgi:hypothetical protein
MRRLPERLFADASCRRAEELNADAPAARTLRLMRRACPRRIPVVSGRAALRLMKIVSPLCWRSPNPLCRAEYLDV